MHPARHSSLVLTSSGLYEHVYRLYSLEDLPFCYQLTFTVPAALHGFPSVPGLRDTPCRPGEQNNVCVKSSKQLKTNLFDNPCVLLLSPPQPTPLLALIGPPTLLQGFRLTSVVTWPCFCFMLQTGWFDRVINHTCHTADTLSTSRLTTCKS